MDLIQFESRKRSHLQHALDPRSQATDRSGLGRVELRHCALPEIDFSDISLATPFRKKALATPFFISGMTAGHAQAREINQRFARAAARRGWIFGVGSQRRELDPARAKIDSWQELRKDSPGLYLLGNLGLSQVIQHSPQEVKKLAEQLQADAFAIHLNALQEALQPEGTPQFKKGLKAIRKLLTVLKLPIILKETGCGFSERSLSALKLLPLAAVDVSGAGGTHWGRIEGFRAREAGDSVRAQAAEVFSDWGISTVESVLAARKILKPATEIWASGGVRTGLDAAKLIALGATRVGFAKPALEAALVGEAALENWMKGIEFQLQVALFAMGYSSPLALQKQARKNGDVHLKNGEVHRG